MNDDCVVQTSGLTKRYGQRAAVDGLDLTVRRGEVYGFLGPNGAGKTTTLRMLLGLVRPDDGTAAVLGHEPGDPGGLARLGALVEEAALYPYLSGRHNLEAIAGYATVDTSRIDEVLEQVGLTSRSDDKAKTYSLGMRQRLGLAAALLKQPELLMLDEPTNGLDPQGMAEMRTLIRRLGRGDRTVLLCSHLLGEVEQTCDRVGIIREGRLVAEGTVAELRGSTRLLVRAVPLDGAQVVAERLIGRDHVAVTDSALHLDIGSDRAIDVTRELVEAGIGVKEIRPLERSLEEAFFQAVDHGADQGAGQR